MDVVRGGACSALDISIFYGLLASTDGGAGGRAARLIIGNRPGHFYRHVFVSPPATQSWGFSAIFPSIFVLLFIQKKAKHLA